MGLVREALDREALVKEAVRSPTDVVIDAEGSKYPIKSPKEQALLNIYGA